MIRSHAGDGESWLARHRSQRPVFACILSFTDTGLIPHISSAGITPQARQYTALADGEVLATGRAHRFPLPPLPAGISPAVISRGLLTGLNIPCHLFSTGLPAPVPFPHIDLPTVVAQAVNTGQAMSLSQAEALLAAGRYWGRKLAEVGQYLVIGECVAGGTTTAQAVLTAQGYSVAGRMSSSHRNANHRQKQTLVDQGLHRWRQRQQTKPRQDSGLAIAAALGDPMQLVAAGMTLAASMQGGVLLAGGSQMLAVYALTGAIARDKKITWRSGQVAVGTTRWVIEDMAADTSAIAQQIGATYLASQLNFSQSPYFQLRSYERGFIKEGVGAGGCAIAAHLYKGWSNTQIRHAVEAQLRISL
ncbi:MAG: nicotinate mononucleotide-dependent phosphoribosyltransferase CobT [Cyanobacteria bacterium J06627_28]